MSFIASGTIVDGVTGIPLAGATIAQTNLPSNGTVADDNGNFSITLYDDTVNLTASYIGYAYYSDTASAFDGGVELVPDDATTLQAVTVTAKRVIKKPITKYFLIGIALYVAYYFYTKNK